MFYAAFTFLYAVGIENAAMPGHKVFTQDGGEIREGLICPYCKLLLKDAVQTSETGQRLCKECFEEATTATRLIYYIKRQTLIVMTFVSGEFK